MEYTYNSYWGTFHHGTPENYNPQNIIGIGYSGDQTFFNRPDCSNVHNKGPLPAGTYTLKGPVESIRFGSNSFDLIPDPSNNMFGREAFMIHADKSIATPPWSSNNCHVASDGCIACPPWTRAIFKNGDILHVV